MRWARYIGSSIRNYYKEQWVECGDNHQRCWRRTPSAYRQQHYQRHPWSAGRGGVGRLFGPRHVLRRSEDLLGWLAITWTTPQSGLCADKVVPPRQPAVSSEVTNQYMTDWQKPDQVTDKIVSLIGLGRRPVDVRKRRGRRSRRSRADSKHLWWSSRSRPSEGSGMCRTWGISLFGCQRNAHLRACTTYYTC